MKLDSSDTIRASPNCVCACRPPNYPCIHTHTHTHGSERPELASSSDSFLRRNFFQSHNKQLVPPFVVSNSVSLDLPSHLNIHEASYPSSFRLLENRTLLRRFPVCRSILSMQIILPPLLHNGCRSNDRTLSRGFVVRLIDENPGFAGCGYLTSD